MRALTVVALSILLFGCGGPDDGGSPDRDVSDGSGASSGGEREAAPEGPDTRQLGEDATFTDLLRAARTLDDRRDQRSDAGCLVRPPAGDRGWRLEADLAVAVRPLRNAPDDLDERLSADGSPVNVLSRWGAYGPGDPAHPTFSAVTTTLPPQRPAARVWVVTDRGVYVRSTEAATEATAPGSASDAAAAIADPAQLGALFVTAEGGLPLSRLVEVLEQVPDALAGRVALAVALEPGTRLPEPRQTDEASADAHCPDGLPPLAEDAPVGSLSPQVIMSSLGPLRQGMEICVGTTGGPGAAGGRVSMALRIGPDGRVEEACAVEDETNDPALRACLANAARATAFPAPDPAGYVDVQLPLVLSPVDSQRQRPVCAP